MDWEDLCGRKQLEESVAAATTQRITPKQQMASAVIGGRTIGRCLDDVLAFDDNGLLHLESMQEDAREHHFLKTLSLLIQSHRTNAVILFQSTVRKERHQHPVKKAGHE